jgi:hypothetical protein
VRPRNRVHAGVFPWLIRIDTIAHMGMGRYSIVLFRDGGEGSGIEAVLDSDNHRDAARSLYRQAVAQHPNRLVMLCDRARVLARSDRSKKTPR